MVPRGLLWELITRLLCVSLNSYITKIFFNDSSGSLVGGISHKFLTFWWGVFCPLPAWLVLSCTHHLQAVLMGIHCWLCQWDLWHLWTLDVSFSLHVWPTFLLSSTSRAGELLWCGLWTKACASGLFRRGLPWVSRGYFWSSLGEKVVRNPTLELSRGECSSVSFGHCAGSAAAGGSVTEDPVSCRRVVARSPDSKMLRKHSFYSIGLLLLPGNTLSTFQRLVSFGCFYLSSTDLPYNSWIEDIVPSILWICVPACVVRFHCHS